MIQGSILRGKKENLFTRFQNNRALVTAEVHKLFELPTVVTENAEDFELLRRKINSCSSNFQMYGIDTSELELNIYSFVF